MPRYSLTLSRKWSVEIKAPEAQIEAMRRDGYVIDELVNTAPEWLPHWAVRPWFRLQDALRRLQNSYCRRGQ